MLPRTENPSVDPKSANPNLSETIITARVWIKAVQGILSLQLQTGEESPLSLLGMKLWRSAGLWELNISNHLHV